MSFTYSFEKIDNISALISLLIRRHPLQRFIQLKEENVTDQIKSFSHTVSYTQAIRLRKVSKIKILKVFLFLYCGTLIVNFSHLLTLHRH